MWEYNHSPSSDELYHHGIKGMKWGVRRYQNKDGSLTSAWKKRYNPKYHEQYKSIYGEKGANRIKKRITDKGYSRKKAVRIEFGRQVTTGLLASAGLGFASYSVASGKVSRLVSKGVDSAKAIIDSRTKAYILDKSGKVIKRYWRSPVKDVVTDLVPR